MRQRHWDVTSAPLPTSRDVSAEAPELLWRCGAKAEAGRGERKKVRGKERPARPCPLTLTLSPKIYSVNFGGEGIGGGVATQSDCEERPS